MNKINTLFLSIVIIAALLFVAGCYGGYVAEDSGVSYLNESASESHANENASESQYYEAELTEGDQGETAKGGVSEETAEEPETYKGAQLVVYEGELVKVQVKGTDPDGDPITYNFGDPLNAQGEWQTKKGDKGTYDVEIEASDGKSTTAKTLRIVVKEENKAPVLEPISDIAVKVGGTVKISPKVSDPNGDKVTLSYSGWMTSSEKEVTENDVGTHTVTVTASDGTLKVSERVKVTVSPLNKPPVIEKLNDVEVFEGDTVSFNPVVVDPDGDNVTVTYSGWMTSSTKKTGYDDAGEYEVTVTASDGKLQVSQTVTVTVKDRNRAPTFDIIIS